jgi:hypothetical protein
MNMTGKIVATLDALSQRHAEARAEFDRQRLGLAHPVDSQPAAKPIQKVVGQCGVRQRAERQQLARKHLRYALPILQEPAGSAENQMHILCWGEGRDRCCLNGAGSPAGKSARATP